MRSLRNGDHIVPGQNPSQHKLCGRLVDFHRELPQSRFVQQFGLLNGRVRHYRNSTFGTPRQEIPFDASSRQIVEYLVGGHSIPAWRRAQFFHIGQIKVADAPMSNLAVVLKAFKGFDGLPERNISPSVDQIQIYLICPESRETPLTCRDRATPSGIVRVHFAD